MKGGIHAAYKKVKRQRDQLQRENAELRGLRDETQGLLEQSRNSEDALARGLRYASERLSELEGA